MLTPYDEPLTRQETDWLGGNGIETVDVHYCDIKENLDRGSQRLADSFERAMGLNWAEGTGCFCRAGTCRICRLSRDWRRKRDGR